MLFGELDLVMGSKSDYNVSLPQKEMEDMTSCICSKKAYCSCMVKL
jgi:hypothetical protein